MPAAPSPRPVVQFCPFPRCGNKTAVFCCSRHWAKLPRDERWRFFGLWLARRDGVIDGDTYDERVDELLDRYD